MADFSSGFSATIASVVSSNPATDAAFCSAVRTTFVGPTIPAFIKPSKISVAALKPNAPLLFLIRSSTIEPHKRLTQCSLLPASPPTSPRLTSTPVPPVPGVFFRGTRDDEQRFAEEQKAPRLTEITGLSEVAGGGFEPPTFGL
jgi:hypothetical protein